MLTEDGKRSTIGEIQGKNEEFLLTANPEENELLKLFQTEEWRQRKITLRGMSALTKLPGYKPAEIVLPRTLQNKLTKLREKRR